MSHLQLPVFSGRKSTAVLAMGYYNGQLMYFVKVNVVIHVFKHMLILEG